MTQLLLDLSNVSARFRKELSDVFWKSTRIYCTQDRHRKELLRFLEHRPSIHAGIKWLHIELDMAGRDATAGRDFRKFCRYTSTTLKLEYFAMRLWFWEVKLDVEVALRNEDDLDEMEQIETEVKFHNLYFSKIKARLEQLSLTVKAPEPQTEEEMYLHSRSLDVAAARKAGGHDEEWKGFYIDTELGTYLYVRSHTRENSELPFHRLPLILDMS